jgi:hypothetical protein
MCFSNSLFNPRLVHRQDSILSTGIVLLLASTSISRAGPFSAQMIHTGVPAVRVHHVIANGHNRVECTANYWKCLVDRVLGICKSMTGSNGTAVHHPSPSSQHSRMSALRSNEMAIVPVDNEEYGPDFAE